MVQSKVVNLPERVKVIEGEIFMDGIIDAEKLNVVTTEKLQYKYDQLVDQYEKIVKDLNLVAEDRDRYKQELNSYYKANEKFKKELSLANERMELYEKVINFIIDAV